MLWNHLKWIPIELLRHVKKFKQQERATERVYEVGCKYEVQVCNALLDMGHLILWHELLLPHLQWVGLRFASEYGISDFDEYETTFTCSSRRLTDDERLWFWSQVHNFALDTGYCWNLMFELRQISRTKVQFL